MFSGGIEETSVMKWINIYIFFSQAHEKWKSCLEIVTFIFFNIEK